MHTFLRELRDGRKMWVHVNGDFSGDVTVSYTLRANDPLQYAPYDIARCEGPAIDLLHGDWSQFQVDKDFDLLKYWGIAVSIAVEGYLLREIQSAVDLIGLPPRCEHVRRAR